MPTYKNSLLALVFAAAAGFAAMAVPLSDEGSVTKLDEAVRPAEEPVAAYVVGAVNRPGVVMLKRGDRVSDAVSASGGALPQADLESMNLAQPVADGMRIRVPEHPDSNGSAAAMGAKEALININSADEKTLDMLPGIGPVMAKRIVEYRREHGDFQSVEELKRVRGIGEAKYEKLKDRITV